MSTNKFVTLKGMIMTWFKLKSLPFLTSRAFLDFMHSSKPELFEVKKTEAAVESSRFIGPDFDQRAMEPEEVVTHWDSARPEPKPRKVSPSLRSFRTGH